MAIGYRAVLRLARDKDAIAIAEEHLQAWLKEKSGPRRSAIKKTDWDGPGIFKLGTQAVLVVVHDEHDARNRRRLYRLHETNPHGRWVVSLYAAALASSREHSQTIVVEVDRVGVERSVALATVDPPKIVRAILDAAEASDGAVTLTGAPVLIRSGQASEVLDAIADPERTASVVVGGSFARELDDSWRKAVTNLTKQSVGVAATYVVYADALGELNAFLPPSHRVQLGHVRTYLPRVDFSDPSDGIRHKWLAPATFSRSIEGRSVATPLQRRHGEVARRRFVDSELPHDVRRTIDLLRRAEIGIERAARVEARVAEAIPRTSAGKPGSIGESTPAATPLAGESDSAPLVERLRTTISRWLGFPKPEIDHLDRLDDLLESKVAEISVAEEQLAEAAEREEALQAELDELRRERDDLELEWAISQESEVTAQREAAVLRNRLAAGQTPEDAFVEPDDESWNPPNTVGELVQRITPGRDPHLATNRVVFTGDEDSAHEIDRRYVTGLYANAFWQYVRVLHDYAEARLAGFSGNVHMYLTDDRTSGTKCPPDRHAATESETVLANAKWRKQRVLPVPVEVDPKQVKLMDAHFKPTHRDTFAPRMHYYDDVDGTGKIYVGYIGRHLQNKQS